MKIWLFSYEEIISNGSNPRLLGYYEYLTRQGDKPCFCFFKGPLQIETDYNYTFTGSKFPFVLTRFLNYFFSLLLYKPCDVAYFYSPNGLFIPLYLACRFRGIKVVVEKTELDSIKPTKTIKDVINWRLYQLDEWMAPRLADRLLVISTKLQKRYSQWSNKTSLIGVFTPFHSHQKPVKTFSSTSSFTIGYFGSFADKDDIETTIKAFNYANKKQDNLVLKLIGNLPNKLSKGRHENNVICVENVANTDIHGHLLSCDVLIAIRKNTPYAHHGFPSKLAEYFATGIPVIATPTSDIPLLFESEKELLIIPHGDLQALGEAILRLQSDHNLCQVLGLNAHQWAEKHWNPDDVLEGWRFSTLAL